MSRKFLTANGHQWVYILFCFSTCDRYNNESKTILKFIPSENNYRNISTFPPGLPMVIMENSRNVITLLGIFFRFPRDETIEPDSYRFGSAMAHWKWYRVPILITCSGNANLTCSLVVWKLPSVVSFAKVWIAVHTLYTTNVKTNLNFTTT